MPTGPVSPGSSGSPSGSPSPGRSRRARDRHGRGLRGPLLPRAVPAWRSRRERFDESVLDAMERLERRLPDALEGIEFAVEEVPPSDPAPWEHGEVPLGRCFPAQGTLPHRVVIYRRPVETRAADDRDLPALIQDVVVEQVAHVLGLSPEQIDPGFGDD